MVTGVTGWAGHKAPLPNHALAARMKEKGFSEARLATAAGVDTKTVGRWVRGESLPRPRTPAQPPTRWAAIRRPCGRTISNYASAGHRDGPGQRVRQSSDIPVTVWTELFGGAAEAIDILVYGGTFSTVSPDSVRRSPPLPSAELLSGSSLATRTPSRSPSAAQRNKSGPAWPGVAG